MTTQPASPDVPPSQPSQPAQAARSSPAPPEPRLMTARSPEDVLAAIPEVLGFVPAESVVMLTFGGTHTFHARSGLPAADEPGEVDDLVAVMLEPALRHRVRSVVLVVYSTDETLARRVIRALGRAFVAHGVGITLRLRADGERWWAPGSARAGVPYDVSSHPFRLESILRGDVTHGSREELAATLEPDGSAVTLVEAHLALVEPMDASDVTACVSDLVTSGETLTDAALAAMARGLLDLGARDAAWAAMHRDLADRHVRLWSDAVRRTPAGLVGAPAAVLALAAWLAGHGALAWCAVDRSLAADPHNTLAALVSDLLVNAVPPASWEETRRAP